jgi:hypothetical protein
VATESFAIGAFAFTAYVLTLALALRTSKHSPAALSVGSAVAIYFATLAAGAFAAEHLLFWYFSAAYCFLTLSFLMVFGAVYKSISLRILLELLERAGGTDSYDSLLERYVAGSSFSDRLEIMISAQLATRSSTGYALTGRGRLIARAVAAMQRAFGIARSG